MEAGPYQGGEGEGEVVRRAVRWVVTRATHEQRCSETNGVPCTCDMRWQVVDAAARRCPCTINVFFGHVALARAPLAPQPPHPPPARPLSSPHTHTQPVGREASGLAAQHVNMLLGNAPFTGPSQEQITSVIAGMTPMQLFEVMGQLKALAQNNHGAARSILVANPQLTKALFQAQVWPRGRRGGGGGGDGGGVGGWGSLVAATHLATHMCGYSAGLPSP